MSKLQKELLMSAVIVLAIIYIPISDCIYDECINKYQFLWSNELNYKLMNTPKFVIQIIIALVVCLLIYRNVPSVVQSEVIDQEESSERNQNSISTNSSIIQLISNADAQKNKDKYAFLKLYFFPSFYFCGLKYYRIAFEISLGIICLSLLSIIGIQLIEFANLNNIEFGHSDKKETLSTVAISLTSIVSLYFVTLYYISVWSKIHLISENKFSWPNGLIGGVSLALFQKVVIGVAFYAISPIIRTLGEQVIDITIIFNSLLIYYVSSKLIKYAIDKFTTINIFTMETKIIVNFIVGLIVTYSIREFYIIFDNKNEWKTYAISALMIFMIDIIESRLTSKFKRENSENSFMYFRYSPVVVLFASLTALLGYEFIGL